MAYIEGPNGLAEAACFYAKLLGIADKEFKLEIIRKNMEYDILGTCYNAGDSEYVIELEKRKRSEPILSVLAHEMVHLKQYLNGELKDVGFYTIWNGKKLRGLNYWDEPWEIEAYGRQKGLYVRYQQHKEAQK